jgi:superfamily II DNA or RNA helicase/HKD family nuclease
VEEGLHESLISRELQAKIDALVGLTHDEATIDDAEEPHVLARHVADAVADRLAEIRTSDERLTVVNSVLNALDPARAVDPPARQLLAVSSSSFEPGRSATRARPRTPLSDAALLTNSPDEPSLAAELKAEMASADSVDLLCAFVKWYGVRLLESELLALGEAGVPLRVVTTTYLGSTERRALDRMIRDFGADVRIQYDAQRTRLHAKAWLFRRNTGFDTAYVGSSNLSRAALLEGVEWNVRLSRVSTPTLLQKFEATFDSYWNDSSFEPYDPDRDRDRLDDALAEAAGSKAHDTVTISISGLEVRPFSYQAEMLEAIQAERVVHDRHRNLVVAATGTGKTVIAALDYRRLCEAWPGPRPSLLFVANRKEILEQSLRTYREVLADGSFGELYVGGTRPERWLHVFASVQSLTSYGVANLPPDHFEIAVIDEFHHAAASTYRQLLNHLTPRELLGLTATPERADGVDVREFFNGRTAAELRLWDALGADLLCPFHYFAVADNTDLRSLTWSRGRYDETQLSNLYTGNRARAGIVIRELQDKVLDVGGMRALGFCVGVQHATYMAEVFNDAGIPAAAVSGETPAVERRQALVDLRERRLNILFSADVFNEGLDIPDVDTVLLLRPTDSATIFLQQLGRGLRRTREKAVLTVLDFVGYQHRQFKWDQKLRALTGHTKKRLMKDIEDGFPFLPSGCQIALDRESQRTILENVKSQLTTRWSQIVVELKAQGDTDLATFLDQSGIELADVLRRGSHSWTRARRDAGLPTPSGSLLEEKLLRRVRAFAHVDDRLRTQAYVRLLADDAPRYAEMSPFEQRVAQMLFFSLWPDGGGHASVDDGLAALRAEAATRDELRSVVAISFDAARHLAVELAGSLIDVPLRVHARYQREEVLAALGYASLDRKPNSFREGVLYVPERNVDAFFVNLKKSEEEFSPTTMYRDYPISPTLFHWESQSGTSVASPTGQRYVNGTSTVLLFVRETKQDAFGTAPYLFLGPATFVSHQGERPIAITWKLDHAMPIDFYNAAAVAAQ